MAIQIVGTYPDGDFVARVNEGKPDEFAIFYRAEQNTAYLHKYIDFFTRFVVFYENDEKLHADMLGNLKKAKAKDLSGEGLKLDY